MCNSCCAPIENTKGLICEQCPKFILCLSCYYAAQIHTNLKRGQIIIKEKSKGELWWKREISKKDFISSKQNEVVRLITQKYLISQAKD